MILVNIYIFINPIMENIKLFDIVKEIISEADPKKGTGKKPEGSDRRLYTDENPKDTVKVKFKTVQDIKDTLSKSSFKSKSHARQSQIINLIHQRVRAAYQNAKDPEVKSRLKNALEYAEHRKEASKEKTERLNSQKENVVPNHDGKSSPYGFGYKPVKLTKGIIKEKCWKRYKKKGMKTMFGKKYPNCVKK